MSKEFQVSPNLKAPILLNNSAGNSGQVLTSQGPSSPPQWTTPSTSGPDPVIMGMIF